MSVADVTAADVASWQFVAMSLIIAWYLLREFSKRLGEALQVRPYYRLFDLALALAVLAIALSFTVFVLGYDEAVVAADVLWLGARLACVAAALLEVAVTVKYWGWIVPEVLALRKK
ncbi:MAG TPA: hypothetical protein VLT35_00285 [Methanocella sp.]|nr:hypothetical protein [Methanocella sp.]